MSGKLLEINYNNFKSYFNSKNKFSDENTRKIYEYSFGKSLEVKKKYINYLNDNGYLKFKKFKRIADFGCSFGGVSNFIIFLKLLNK
jgi:hypothetical protein